MCARHDATIGAHLLELEPLAGHVPGTILIYISISDLSDGSECWKGCVRLTSGDLWDAIVYGGSPLQLDCHTDEVPSG